MKHFWLHTQNYYLFYTHTHTRTHFHSYSLYSLAIHFIFIEINKRSLISRPTAAAASLSLRWAVRVRRSERGEVWMGKRGASNAIAFGPKTFPGRTRGEWGNAKLRMHSCVKMILKLVLNCVRRRRRRRRQSKGVWYIKWWGKYNDRERAETEGEKERGTQGKHTKFWQLLIVQRAVQDFVYLTWTAETTEATATTAAATIATATTTCLLSMQLQNASSCQGQIMLRFSFSCEITHSNFNLSFSLRPPVCRDKRSSQSGKMVLSFTPQLAKAAGEICLALPCHIALQQVQQQQRQQQRQQLTRHNFKLQNTWSWRVNYH